MSGLSEEEVEDMVMSHFRQDELDVIVENPDLVEDEILFLVDLFSHVETDHRHELAIGEMHPISMSYHLVDVDSIAIRGNSW